MYEKVIEMDIWSSYGCFNKSFSNKGGLLTYPIPPKTVIVGMIGAVLGINFDDYEIIDDEKVYAIDKFFDVEISVQSLFDFKTSRLIYNNCDKNISNINQDILINPKYKIFLSFPDYLKEYESEFLHKIKNHTTVYNLYMGRNEFLLNYEYIDVFDREDSLFGDDSDLNDLKVIGFINRRVIRDLKVYKEDERTDFFVADVPDSKPFFEYMINDYPIKRTSFTRFSYEFISFFPKDDNKDSYFTDIKLKDNSKIRLTKINGGKWICLI